MPTLALILTLIISTIVRANEPCTYLQSKKADLKTITEFDEYLVGNFASRNKSIIQDINRESLEALSIARRALSLGDIKSLAKRLKAGQKIVDGKNVQRILDAKIMRLLPPSLNQNRFYQESLKDGKTALDPIFVWPDSTIRAVAEDRIPMTLRASGIRKVKGRSSAPEINHPKISSGITLISGVIEDLADPKLGLKPWEIAVFGTLKTKDSPTEYPRTEINQNRTRHDTFFVEYRTSIFVLDVQNGTTRYLNSPPSEYHSLGKNKGAARIVSDTRMQRISLEREISTCQ